MMKAMKKRLPFLMATLLAACAVGPDYRPPENILPGNFGTPITGSAEEKTVNPLWWTLFQDNQLNQLVEAAFKQNTDMRLALSRIEEASAMAREAGAAFFPNISLNANSSNTGLSNQTTGRMPGMTPSVRHNQSIGLSTSYELDLFGRVRRSNEATQARLLASHYSKDAIRLTVAGLVSSAYLQLRAADAELRLTADTIKTREESVLLTKTRLDAGLVSPIDYHQANGLLSAARAQEAEFRRLRALSEHLLALLTAEPTLKIVPGDIKNLPLPPVPPMGLPAQLIENRPDVRQAEALLIASNANIGLAKAAYYPQFSLTGNLGSESQTLSNLFTGSASTWGMLLSFFMPILDFGQTSARVDQAKAVNEQSLITWQNSLQVAYKEVRDALVNLDEYAAAETAMTERVESAKQVLNIAKARYLAGQSGYLELLDAERTHNDAQIALITTRQARLNASVDLFKALGGGWQPDVVLKEGLFLRLTPALEKTPAAETPPASQ